ncbi:unnamed protein product [Peronospora belbahrii]|uniref:Uncharacterized protein n=1 Tax=Peronospora belbahrii TaxID=622444 RepID=A0ABN8CV05_9STRA|nr:unnamed protein product [Peronospora belbahrii]
MFERLSAEERLRTEAAAQARLRAEHERNYEEAENQVQGAAAVKALQQAAIEEQAQKMAKLQEEYMRKRNELLRQHDVECRAVKERKASTAMHRADVEEQKRADNEREAKLIDEAQKLKRSTKK